MFSVMTFVWMMITTDNEGNGDVKDFGSNTNGVEDVLKSTATPTKKKKSSSFMHHEYYSRIVPPLKAPIHLYVASASLIGDIHFPRESLVQIHQLRHGDGVEIEQTDTGDSPLLGVAETNVPLVGLFSVRFVSDRVVFFRVRGTRREQTVRRGRSHVVRVWVFSVLLLRVRRRGAVERGG